MNGAHLAFRAQPDVSIDADYVVVGSGSGGSAAAIVLARAGYRVVIVEAGAWRDAADYPETMLGVMRDLFPDWGANVATGDSILPIVQAQVVGGGTVINSAIMVRTPGDVIEQWDQDHGLGDVLDHRRMGAALDEIASELHVTDTRVDVTHFGENNQRLLDGLTHLGLDTHPTLRNVRGCQASARCLQGCRHSAKQAAHEGWIPEVMSLGGAVLSCAPVTRICRKNGVAIGVKGRFRHPQTRKKGAHFRVQAKRGVLMAASATGTAPLLQRSGIALPALGRFWRAHPGAGIIGVYPDEVDLYHGATQGTASIAHRMAHGLKLESLALPLELVAGRTGGAGTQLTRRLQDIRHQAMWVSAVRAEAEGTVKAGLFGGVRVRYRPTIRDLKKLRIGSAVLAKAHFDQGARAVRPGIVGLPFEIGPDEVHLIEEAPLDNRAWTWVLSHLFGGAVMGSDPERSVVGPDLHVRGARQLHVVDASVLPTTLGVNPQHTIMAVAQIIARRLANSDHTRHHGA